MLQHWQTWRWQLQIVKLFVFCSAIALGMPPAIGQSIETDGTLGPARVLTGPNYSIPQTDGLTVNNNLFHSFSRFNIGTGESATFESATTIRNIFSRVTGGSPSSIDGLLSTQSRDVNFFLMNPSGIVFGPNARLNIGSSTRGSFVATTVDTLLFPKGQRFSAKNPEAATELLRIVGDPSGFIASQQVPGSIQISGNLSSRNLSVNANQSLLLLGGDISLTGRGLSAPGGRIEMGSIADGQIDLATKNNALSFVFRDDIPRMNISLNGASLITSSGITNAGDISIYAKDITTNKSNLLTVVAGSQNGGNVTLDASNMVSLTNSSISTQATLSPVLKVPTGNAGSVLIKANNSVEIADRSNINTSSIDKNSGNVQIETMGSLRLSDTVLASSSQQGNAGNIALKAGDVTSISKGSIDTSTGSLSEITSGNSGNITIETGDLTIDKDTRMSTAATGAGQGGDITFTATKGSLNLANSEIRTRTNNRGNAGNIVINAVDSVNVSGTLSNVPIGGLYTSTGGDGRAGNIAVSSRSVRVSDKAVFDARTTAGGAGGTIEITAETLEVVSGGQLRTTTSGTAPGSGNAGDITAEVRDRITLSGAGSGLFVNTTGSGNAGSLNLKTQSLSISDGAQISAATSNQGTGGSVTVNAQDLSVNNDAQILATTSGEGAGGNISIKARSFEANTGGQLRTTTSGSGNAGNITATVADNITLTGTNSGLFANTTPKSSGNGGSITIDPQTFMIRDGARVAVDSQGSGQGGNIQIQAENLTLDNQGQISAETASSQGGNIDLQVGQILLLRRNSQISTTAGTAQAGGNGGNIRINALFVVALPNENSDITANAFTGRGGRVDITTQGIFGIAPRARLTSLSDITASSQFGISGVVTINTPDIDPGKGLVQLPGTPVDPSNQIRQSCRPAGTQQASSFIVTGRGGIPISPERTIQQTPLTAWVAVNDHDRAQQTSDRTGNPPLPTPSIVEAQGWIKDAQGNVWLVSNAPATNTASDWKTLPVCR